MSECVVLKATLQHCLPREVKVLPPNRGMKITGRGRTGQEDLAIKGCKFGIERTEVILLATVYGQGAGHLAVA